MFLKHKFTKFVIIIFSSLNLVFAKIKLVFGVFIWFTNGIFILYDILNGDLI